MKAEYKYSIEMFKIWSGEEKPRWGTDIRIYNGEKKLTDFDLHDVMEKRKNAKLISNKPPSP